MQRLVLTGKKKRLHKRKAHLHSLPEKIDSNSRNNPSTGFGSTSPTSPSNNAEDVSSQSLLFNNGIPVAREVSSTTALNTTPTSKASESNGEAENVLEYLPVRSRKRKRDPEMWKKNIRKRLRNSGKEYVTSKNKIVEEKKTTFH